MAPPIPGVTISIEGLSLGSVTDFNGNYSLVVPEGSTLIFSFIGYETQNIVVGVKNIINVTLTEDVSSMDEFVVVGYGEQRKTSLTSAVADIKGEDLIRRPVANAPQALQGLVAGVTVIDGGGGPGKSEATIRGRGITTLSGNDPLVMVDGIEQKASGYQFQ